MKKRKILLILAAILLFITLIFQFNWFNLRTTLSIDIRNKVKNDFFGKIVDVSDNTIQTQKTVKSQIALLTDIHNDIPNLNKAITEINSENIPVTFVLGDLTNTGTEQEFAKVNQSLARLKNKYYVLPGDHDLWASREKGKNAKEIFNTYFSNLKPPNILNNSSYDILTLDNSDIYLGVDHSELEAFKQALTNSHAKLNIILSHKAIYHPLTLHKMGYINDTAVPEIVAQADDLIKSIKAIKNRNLVLINGDLHSYSKNELESSTIPIYSVGAVTTERNFQLPRYALINIYQDNTAELIDKPI